MEIAVIGAGSWGTTLAWLLGEKGLEVRLGCRSPEQAEALCHSRATVNPNFLAVTCLSPAVDRSRIPSKSA